jgi:hypothetical protein
MLMQYFGGKQRIAKRLAAHIETYWETILDKTEEEPDLFPEVSASRGGVD